MQYCYVCMHFLICLYYFHFCTPKLQVLYTETSFVKFYDKRGLRSTVPAIIHGLRTGQLLCGQEWGGSRVTDGQTPCKVRPSSVLLLRAAVNLIARSERAIGLKTRGLDQGTRTAWGNSAMPQATSQRIQNWTWFRELCWADSVLRSWQSYKWSKKSQSCMDSDRSVPCI